MSANFSELLSRPKRWDTPFGPEMSDETVERLLDIPALRTVDASLFPQSLSLENIIRFDSRIRRFRRGDVVVLAGDYGNSVFFVTDGSLQVLLTQPDELSDGGNAFTRGRSKRLSVFDAMAQLWRKDEYPEVRDIEAYKRVDLNLRADQSSDGEVGLVLKDLEATLQTSETVTISREQGEMVGEIAALTRSLRTATVVAGTDCELLEMRWQGLRDIRSRDESFRRFIDDRYRERSLSQQLAETDLFRHLSREQLEIIASQSNFETYGDFEWNKDFRKSDLTDPQLVYTDEPIVAEEGHYSDGLLVVGSGFGRVTFKEGRGERTINYLSKHDVFGLRELYDQYQSEKSCALECSLRAIGYLDIIRVPTRLMEEIVLPTMPRKFLPERQRKRGNSWDVIAAEYGISQATLDFFVDNRTINGTQSMLIDVDRCVGCDDCVKACANAHNNNPRFVRNGTVDDNVMVAHACMHCVDPVCLIGCPTGAIHRDQETGYVIINDLTCIGCGTCANSCPYDNIKLVEIRDQNGGFIVDSETKSPIVKATKCDFCIDQIGGPACQRACPHDALIRIDMRDRRHLAEWLSR